MVIQGGAQRQERAVQKILSKYGSVGYDYEYRRRHDGREGFGTEVDGYFRSGQVDEPQRWFSGLLGKHYYCTVVSADIGTQTESALAPLNGLPHLRYLRLSQVPDAAWAQFPCLRHLQSLRYTASPITPVAADQMGALNSLRELHLFGECSDETLQAIGGMTSLERLTIEGCNLNNDQLRLLKRLTNLRRLMVAGKSISDQGLDGLTGMQRLEVLKLAGCHITDDGVAQLVCLPQLRRLSGDLILTDRGLEHLKAMPRLRSVFFITDRTSEAGITALKRACPMLHVYSIR